MFKYILQIMLLNILRVQSYPPLNWSNSIFNEIPQYISRSEWKASPSNDVLISKYEPVLIVVVKNTNAPYCISKQDCASSVKLLQDQSIANGYNDIEYNFVIDPSGNIYEGLGWSNLQTNRYDQEYRTIGMIGNGSTELGEAITELLKNALSNSILDINYKLCGAPDIIPALKNVKIDLEMDLDYVNSADPISQTELRKLRTNLSMENLDCVVTEE